MSLVYLDGAEIGNITDPGRWSYHSGGWLYDSSYPRHGNRCIATNQSNFRYIERPLPAHQTYIVGFAFRPSGPVPSSFLLISLRDGSASQIYVAIDASSMNLKVYRGDGTLLEDTGVFLTRDIYQYIEFKATIHNTIGSYELRLNGTTIASGSNVDTQVTANAVVNYIELQYDGGNSSSYRYDDLYICDGGGSKNNDFLGDILVEALLPNGDGASSQFTPQGGGPNYVEVDEAGASDGDTTYVESATAGDKDTYQMSDLVTTAGSVFGVIVEAYARKTQAGTRSLALVARSGGSESMDSAQALSTSYQYLSGVFESDPNGGGDWSIASVNAAEFGMEVAT